MRTLPTDFLTELQKEELIIAHLIEIELQGPVYYRYTEFGEDIYYQGNQFLSRGIEFSAAELSLTPKVDNISFDIDNVGLEVSAFILNNETRGKKCTIYKAALNKYIQVVSAATLFIGYLDRVNVDHNKGRFEVVNSFIKWRTQTPRRIHSATCPWTFKGDECGYSGGETWCDQSWDRCSTLTNTPQFGGFRFLPALQDKEISWGKKL